MSFNNIYNRGLCKYFREIVYLLGDGRKKLPQLWAANFIVSLLDMVSVALIGPFVTMAINPTLLEEQSWIEPFFLITKDWSQNQLILLFGTTFLLIFYTKSLLGIALTWWSTTFAHEQESKLRSWLISVYLSLPYEQYLTRDRSYVITTLTDNISRYSASLTLLLRLLSEAVITIALLLFLAWISPLAFILLAVLVGAAGIAYDRILGKRSAHWGAISVEGYQRITKGVQEGIEGIKEIKILGCEHSFIRRVTEASNLASKAGGRHAIYSSLPRYAIEGSIVTFVVLLVLISHMIDGSDIEIIPVLSMFGVASIRIIPAANSILSGLSVLRYHHVAISRLYNDIQNIPGSHISDLENRAELQFNDFSSIKVDDVYYRYPNQMNWALSGASLEIRKGDLIGITGASGAGKSTLIDLILGLIEPQHGSIQLNGTSIQNNLFAWQNKIAYIPQMTFMLDDSLRRNIALGVDDEQIDNDRLDKVICQAELLELVQNLPQGKDTLIGDRGIRLSGGQRQRIAIARALYFDREILILDEATSALDNETEEEIVHTIESLQGIKTMIVIAHRLSTLKNCGRLVKIEDGKIL